MSRQNSASVSLETQADQVVDPIQPARPDLCGGESQHVAWENLAFCIDRHPIPGFNQPPRLVLRHEDAREACAARGMRLCTRKEWRRACMGPGGLRYPYGERFDPYACATRAMGIRPSGSQLRCRSAYGVYDLSGNAWEWTHNALVMGGGDQADAFEARCASQRDPRMLDEPVGAAVRCCRSLIPEESPDD